VIATAREPRRLPLARLARAPGATAVAGSVFALLLAFVLVWPAVSPYGANEIDFDRALERPSLAHPLGTDMFGRDLLTRVAVGGRTTMTIAVLALGIIVSVGAAYGIAAALAGRRVDSLMMRLVDGLLALPRLPIAIVILVVLGLRGQNVGAVVLALSIAGWMLTARLVRGHVVSLRNREFVRAARALGASWPAVARRHIVPNSAGILAVAVFLELPTVVLGEAFLAVLGLGPPPPTATWGTIAYDGWNGGRAWDMLVATVAIAAFAVSANVLADGLNDRFDPRRRGGSG
jgi:ABC-type dipeptide/oligopeptide/nickel transport system permease subunit